MSPHEPVIRKIGIVRPITRLRTVCFADIEPKPINWLWPDKIARGKLTLISGDPGLGKSLITVALASAVSTGARWPVGGGSAPLGSVLMLSDEDSKADTIRPRLDAAGADCTKVHGMQMVQEITEDGETHNRGFSLSTDIDRLATRVEEIGDVALIEIDPISAYLGGTDSHKNSDVRALLSPLSDLADRFNLAVVVVTHLNKGSGSAMYRSVGSIAFTAAARTAWAVTKDKDDPARRLMLPVKNNLGNDHSGMAYRVETASNDAPVVMWESTPVEIDINEALSTESDDYRSEREEAMDWLQAELYSGPVPSKQIFASGRDAGFSVSTLRRAKTSLGVVPRKTGMKGGWEWYLPDDLPIAHEDVHEDTEDTRSQNVGTFGNLGHLREDSEEVSL